MTKNEPTDFPSFQLHVCFFFTLSLGVLLPSSAKEEGMSLPSPTDTFEAGKTKGFSSSYLCFLPIMIPCLYTEEKGEWNKNEREKSNIFRLIQYLFKKWINIQLCAPVWTKLCGLKNAKNGDELNPFLLRDQI